MGSFFEKTFKENDLTIEELLLSSENLFL